jgi:hypothetical protein
MTHSQSQRTRFRDGSRPNPVTFQAEKRLGTGSAQAAGAGAGSGRRNALGVFLAAAMVLTLLAGCDRLSRHKVMTFFFTGVPSLEEQDRMKQAALEEKKKPKEARKSTTVPQATAGKRERTRSVAVRATRFSHGPYAANECFQCHEVSASGGFRGFGKQEEAAG